MNDGRSRYWQGVACALLAALSWGVMSPIAKVVAAAGVSLMSAMVVRAFIVVAVMGPWLLFTRGRSVFLPQRRVLRYYLLCGVLSVVCSGGGFLMSLEYLSVAHALILHYTFPLVTLLGSLWVTHEKPTRLQVLAGFLIIAGVFSGMGGGGSFAGVSLKGVLWGMLAIAGISGQSLVGRRAALSGIKDQMALLFFSHLCGCLILLVGKSLLMGWSDLAFLTPRIGLLMLLQGTAGSLLAFGFFYTSLKYIPAATASLLCTMEMVVAVGLAALALGQIPSAHETVGCLIIISAIALATVKPHEKTPAEEGSACKRR